MDKNTMIETRGIRNNNPGNIRLGQPWKGLCKIQSDDSFCQFISPQFGIRALVKILRTYVTKYGDKTIKQIIDRYAPPNENDTGAYAKAVAADCYLKPDDDFVFGDILPNLLKAIIRHENGEQPYGEETIIAAIKLADY